MLRNFPGIILVGFLQMTGASRRCPSPRLPSRRCPSRHPYHGNALITACKKAPVFSRCPCSIANLTTTRSFDGITQMCCPSYPSHEKQSAGTPGYRRSPASPTAPPFSHHNAPYFLPFRVYFTQPSGNNRCPSHTPSHKYNKPNRAQSLAVAYKNDDPTNVPR